MVLLPAGVLVGRHFAFFRVVNEGNAVCMQFTAVHSIYEVVHGVYVYCTTRSTSLKPCVVLQGNVTL